MKKLFLGLNTEGGIFQQKKAARDKLPCGSTK